MKIVEQIFALREAIEKKKTERKTIGFVPTMGALHKGHISLIKQSVKENGYTVASIFVNPTQFNDPNDLKNYPRTLETDIILLKQSGCDLLFAPSVDEMYPETDTRTFDFGHLDKVMEGAFRFGHFNGVARIVSKLFDAVQPDRAYFGEKDFQQLTIIREMASQLNLTVEIVGCPTVREPDGLAMSSRNTRLTLEEREIAPKIAETLKNSRTFVSAKTVNEVIGWVSNTIDSYPEMRTEYFQIIDGETLQSVTHWNEADYIVGCIAVFCGQIRLIDNIRYK